MPPFRDLTGQTFNDLTAISREGTSENGNILWKFRCICGSEIVHKGSTVAKGEKISCGCHKDRKRVTPRICRYCDGPCVKKNQQGFIGNVCHACAAKRMAKYLKENPTTYMVNCARHRARNQGVPFDITKDDIVIPEFCPILGIKMSYGPFAERDSSPSLDKIIPELGYVKGNIAVICFRANRFKSDGTLDELRAIVKYMEEHRERTDLIPQASHTNFQESIQ